MTRLEHANIVVTRIGPTLAFLEAAFPHWRVRGGGDGEWYGKPRKWLHFGDDHFYITLNDNGEGPQRDLAGHAPGLAHIGFEVTSIAEIEKRLAKAGYEPSIRGEEGPGRRNLYYIDPEGLEFEFVEYLSDDPAVRNAYE
jgi:catechol 2,3-dioxygenase-like lactoylglutathione lyase family enzyme